jgi:nucleoside-diphosphate-sugar epimerase
MQVGKNSEIFKVLSFVQPDTIYHLGQMPSAPYSMANPYQSVQSYTENVAANLTLLWGIKEYCPRAHLVKLGTMGEYGTPGVPIPEGNFTHNYHWAMDSYDLDGMQFPRKPGSIYHSSKVADSVNCEMLYRLWGLKISNIMQGVVYGNSTLDLISNTRLDIDEQFGTVINRFCAQAVLGMPLTVYGAGGQTRGYLPLMESVECLSLVGNQPYVGGGFYETYNQFGRIMSVNKIAEYVQEFAGCPVEIKSVPNPRVEEEEHTYETTNQKLKNLGYVPDEHPGKHIEHICDIMQQNLARLEAVKHMIQPKTNWR